MPAFPDRVTITGPAGQARNPDTGNMQPVPGEPVPDVPALITRQASQRQNQENLAGQATTIADWVMLIGPDVPITEACEVRATAGQYDGWRFVVTDLPAPRRGGLLGRAVYTAVPLKFISDMQGASA